MIQLLSNYNGLDFLAMILGVISIYALGEKNRFGFIVGLSSQAVWIIVNSWAHIWAGIILNVILIALNIRGYLLWSKK